MARYDVQFVIHDWISVGVSAENPEEAKEKAEKKLDNKYKGDITCNDGRIKYVGFYNQDVIDLGD